ncbi:MAG: YceD family protein [Acidiferrobacterales bacterium]
MFGVLPAVIDPIRLADDGSVLEGEIALEEMSRLRELCLTSAARVRVSLKFEHSAQGTRIMQGVITTRLDLACQRCLKAVTQEIEVALSLILLRTGESPATLAEETDFLEIAAPISLSAMVEDEIVLALPIAPRHPEGICTSAQSGAIRPPVPVLAAKEPARPFSALADLKRKE